MLNLLALPLLAAQVVPAASFAADRAWLCEGIVERVCPVQVVPGPFLRIVARSANVVLDRESEIELQPSAVGVGPADECVLVDGTGRRKSAFGTQREPVPPMRIALTTPRVDAQVFAVSTSGRRRIGKYELRIDAAAPTVGLSLRDGWIVPTSKELGTFVFFGQEPLGFSPAGSFRIDSRRLAPGYYEFWTVPLMAGGEIGPLRKSEIWIGSRWNLEVPAGTVTAEGRSRAHVEVSAKAEGIPSAIEEAWVYVDGVKAASIAGASGRIELDLASLSSGLHRVAIIGRCADGRLVAPESAPLDVRNPFLDAEVRRSARLAELQRLMAEARRLDGVVADLYERAVHSPEGARSVSVSAFLTVSEFSATCSVGLVDRWEPSDRPRLFGACRRAIVQQAAVRLEVGRLLVRLGRKKEAREWLSEAIRQAGEASATATEASALLRGQ